MGGSIDGDNKKLNLCRKRSNNSNKSAGKRIDCEIKWLKYIEREICICYNASRQNDISYSLAVSNVISIDLTLRKTLRALPLRVFLFRLRHGGLIHRLVAD